MEEIAQVYARSLFEVAKEQSKLDVVKEQLGQFADALDGNRELSIYFFSPYFSTKEKAEGLGRLLEGVDPTVENFLALLIENHRMPVVFRVRREYDALWEEEHKLLPVTVTSAVALDDATVKSIGDAIGRQTGQQVELTANVDPDVLGGLIVRVGNSILDASIRNRLENLRRSVASS
ncbi:MAG TPA: ATP synthase F1 subunit delta [Baekduia sp.]|uniref:ATP synthase F1 subunit delta n=1 Tax=Baekduia sp. TaxID=2600305 RepID=UPI002D799FB2|nr:ATP synthase F1 subunit delta [Baekduia sp.]HET6506703.1 ATP synthase F1 subunit delta [Baekduia sp.]